MTGKQALTYVFVVLAVCAVSAAAVFGPAVILRHYDSATLGFVFTEDKDIAIGGYQYALSVDEKLHILSNALNNRILPQSEYYAAMRSHDGLSDIRTQSYAFQPVYYETEFNDATRSAAFDALLEELSLLAAEGILPALDSEPNADLYNVSLFTAIDVLEPRKSVTVWEFSFSGTIIKDGLVDCIMDAQTHKLYSISIRANKSWDDYNANDAIGAWTQYIGASSPEPYTPGSPLHESATYFSRFAIRGMDGAQTIATVGYYEGINEFFIKISR